METGIDVEEPDDREPEELARWLAAGFDAAAAEVWRRWRYSIAQARTWEGAGVTDGLRAAQWSTAGVVPKTVAEWRTAGIEAPEAVRWHEFGYGLNVARAEKAQGNGPDQAYQRAQQQSMGPAIRNVATSGLAIRGPGMSGPGNMMRTLRNAGVDPRVIHSYAQHQWVDASALEWARHGIDAGDAYVWHQLGVAPVEAGRQERLGRTVGEVVREWWAAGVPLEEFADWLGAGLTAAEAMEQRARGITAEHAAALRALRTDDAPDLAASSERRRSTHARGAPRIEHPGPPPQDEVAARAAIDRAFAGIGEIDEEAGTIPSVEGSEGLAACHAQAEELARHRFGGEIPAVAVAFTVTSCRFVNDHEAVVVYTAQVTGSLEITLADRPGRALLVDGQWKVARETFCEWMQVAGVECPPRGDP
jgi:hypothetical protein